MAYMRHDELEALGSAAVRRVIGDTFERIHADTGPDFEGRVAYHFTVVFHTEADRRRASSRQTEMTRALIDDLDKRGDEHFPFLRIKPEGTWNPARNAAAE